MPEQSGFNHIEVTPASEDDEVIVAGSASASAPAVSENAESVEHTSPKDSSAGNAGKKAVSEEASPKAGQVALKNTVEKDAYRETTMEDIKSTKMSGMQKAIVVVAILIIIAFIVYSVVA